MTDTATTARRATYGLPCCKDIPGSGVAATDVGCSACVDEAWADLGEVAKAIGSVRWMDPPDGGDVTLAEQVRRMRADLEAAEAENATLKREIVGLREGLEFALEKMSDWNQEGPTIQRLKAALTQGGK
jgi:hypothetical protein